MNILIIIVFSIPFITAYSVIGPKNDSNYQNIKPFVINGRDAKEGEVPWQVGLFFNDYNNPFCGGSIISTRAVLTAAHCCAGIINTEIIVRYDGIDYSSLKIENYVTEIIIHEDYNPFTTDFDYCVLLLANDVPVGESETVAKIELASAEPHEGDTAIVSGWGVTNGVDTSILQVADMSISNKAKCVTEWSNYGQEVTDRMLCAQSTNSTDCYGDSGGPLTVRSKLVGIVSWGAPGCPVNSTLLPNVYSNVFSGKDWIKDKCAC